MSSPTLTSGYSFSSGATVTPARLNAMVSDGGIELSATDKIVGRETSGAGAAEEIACTAAGRAMIAAASAQAQSQLLGLSKSEAVTYNPAITLGPTNALVCSVRLAGDVTFTETAANYGLVRILLIYNNTAFSRVVGFSAMYLINFSPIQTHFHIIPYGHAIVFCCYDATFDVPVGIAFGEISA